jgi:hypothetical protein
LLRDVAVVVLACLLAFSPARTNWVRSLENIHYDCWQLLSGVRYLPRHAAFISIDDETLAAGVASSLLRLIPYRWCRIGDNCPLFC